MLAGCGIVSLGPPEQPRAFAHNKNPDPGAWRKAQRSCGALTKAVMLQKNNMRDLEEQVADARADLERERAQQARHDMGLLAPRDVHL